MKYLVGLLLSFGAAWALAAVEINTANEAELDSVNGLGPASTARILAARSQGPFVDWPDLMRRVSGIRPATARRLSRNGLTVNGVPWEPATTNGAASTAIGSDVTPGKAP
jgi:competence protein ComEA